MKEKNPAQEIHHLRVMVEHGGRGAKARVIGRSATNAEETEQDLYVRSAKGEERADVEERTSAGLALWAEHLGPDPWAVATALANTFSNQNGIVPIERFDEARATINAENHDLHQGRAVDPRVDENRRTLLVGEKAPWNVHGQPDHGIMEECHKDAKRGLENMLLSTLISELRNDPARRLKTCAISESGAIRLHQVRPTSETAVRTFGDRTPSKASEFAHATLGDHPVVELLRQAENGPDVGGGPESALAQTRAWLLKALGRGDQASEEKLKEVRVAARNALEGKGELKQWMRDAKTEQPMCAILKRANEPGVRALGEYLDAIRKNEHEKIARYTQVNKHESNGCNSRIDKRRGVKSRT